MALSACVQSELGRALVAGSGFLADGYDLFVISLVEIVLEEEFVRTGMIGIDGFRAAKGAMASAALAGAVVGQLVFGALADRIGRRVVFIVTAVLIIAGSLLSSAAQQHLVPGGGVGQLFVQIAVARFVMGVGIGGEYPLSASIAAEGCSKRRSATLMAVVFASQGWGYLLACVVMLLLVGSGASGEVTWRTALALGAAIPAAALPFRMMMHESDDFEKVKKQRAEHRGKDACPTMKQYRWHLLGTAVNWFLWDVVWYSNGLFSQDIADVLQGVGSGTMGLLIKKTIIVLCMLPGFFLSIALLNRLGRKNIQIFGYLALAVLFLICGAAYRPLKESAPWLFFTLYALTFLFANFGPNTTTYVVPGEIYPSQIKATFHGMSAASGKIGGVVGAELFPLLHPKEPRGKVICLLLCAGIALAGVVCTAVFTPRYTAEDLEPHLDEETVGFVPLRWQRSEYQQKADDAKRMAEARDQSSEADAGLELA